MQCVKNPIHFINALDSKFQFLGRWPWVENPERVFKEMKKRRKRVDCIATMADENFPDIEPLFFSSSFFLLFLLAGPTITVYSVLG